MITCLSVAEFDAFPGWVVVTCNGDAGFGFHFGKDRVPKWDMYDAHGFFFRLWKVSAPSASLEGLGLVVGSR